MSIFGTGFGQNTQQQQQQQQPNAFGQTNSFGGTGFGAFAQNAPQQQQQQAPQQPQVNPMFGNLASSTSTPGGGFGAFGNASTSTSAFGQPKPAFGSSGGTSAFGGGQPSAFGNAGGGGAFGNAGTSGAFGSSGASGSAFGQPAGQQQPSPFGGGGLFGKPQGSTFGSTALATTTGPTTGTANPPYQEVQERDQTAGVSTTLHYQAISCMPAYRNSSFEELRVQDYQQGRRTANAFGSSTPSAFGQPAQQQQPPAGIFGQPATGAFGQQSSQPASGGFSAFAQPQQPQQQSAFGAFGQPQQPSTGGFGAFGQQPQAQQQQQQPPATGFSAFAQPSQQQQQPATGFGAFAQQNQQNKGFGAFAQPQPQPNPSPFSAFGSGNTNALATGSSAFNQPQQNQSPFGAFGQQNPQANQQQGTNPLLKPSVFGQPNTNSGLFGNTSQQPQGGGLFGNTGQQQPQPQQSGGLFGNPSGGAAFGQTNSQPQQPSSVFGQPSGGLFGNPIQQQQNQPQQNQQAPGGFGSLFSKPAGGGLFGNTQQNQQQNPNPSNPLFGGGGGLFGNSSTQQQQQQQVPSTTNPLFGGASSGQSLFGGKPPAPAPGFGALGGGGLFGNFQQPQQQPQGGLFGNTNAQPQQNQQPSLFGGNSSFLGGSTQQQQTQPSLTASIDQPLPNAFLTSLPQLPSLAASISPKKKSNVFADIAARSSPRLGMGVGINYTPPGPGSKLRGFATSGSTATLTKNPFSLPPPGSPAKSGQVFNESKSLLPPDAFASSSGGSLQLLGGARQSVKKLVLDKRVNEDELHRLRTVQGGSTSPLRAREVRFSPALSVAAREKDNEPHQSPSPALAPTRVTPRAGTRLSDTPSASSIGKPDATSPASSAPLDPQEGEYWCLPTVAELQRLSFNDLQAVKDFTVGCVGFGTIQFLQPVDLTSVPSIADIPGKIVNFEHVECVLYPDERLKPPAGEGLNVPARIKLDRCWALDKSTREPIKDPKDPKHLTRLRKMQGQDGAKFVGFDMETGVWEFTVQEF